MRRPFRLLVVCSLILLLLIGAGSSLIGAQDVEQQFPEELATVEPPIVPEELATFIPEELATFIPEELATLVPPIEPTLIPEELATLVPPIEPTLMPPVEPTLVPPVQPTLVPPVQPTLVPSVQPTLVPPVEPDNFDGSGIRYKILPGTTQGGGGQQLQPYLFTFDLYASIPGHPYSEPMIVSVRTGSFAFSAGDENLVVIDAAGAPIPMLATIDDPPYFQASSESSRVLLVLVDDTGQPCTSLCAIPAGWTVLVQPGNTVYLPGGTSCFWCSIDTMGAELEVYAVLPSGAGPRQFSWTQLEGIGTAWAGPGAVRASILPGFAYGCRGHIGG